MQYFHLVYAQYAQRNRAFSFDVVDDFRVS